MISRETVLYTGVYNLISMERKPIRCVVLHSLIFIVIVIDDTNPNSIFCNSFVRNDNNKHTGANNGTGTLFGN